MTEAEPMETRGNEFILSKVFEAHKQDVKCVISTTAGGLITGSRDETVKVWAERAGRYEEMIEIRQRNKLAVNSIAFYQAKDGQWLLFAGLKDGSIEVFNAGASEPMVTLYEHTSNVCVLYVDVANQLLLSGSWDSRAIVWSIDDIVQGKDFITRTELTRHTHSVWAISSIPTNPIHYLTGSADRKIKLHNSNLQEVLTFEGHTDVVRSVCPLSETIFVSAANDSTLRVWDIDTGKCIQKCETTHGEYIYSICKLESKTGQEFIIAGGEKGYCEIYAIQEKRVLHYVQQIRVPVQSVCTGSVYIFTVDKDRSASEDLLQSFDAEFAVLLAKEVENQKESDSVTIKVSLDDNAPNLDLKYVKGTDPAVCAEKFITDNRLPASYLNEIIEYIKTNVPEARLAEAAKYRRQETQRETIDGELFDYALEVKLKENGPPMKLGYNIGEDPDYATQRFVEKHNLNVGIMGQLSAFLRSQIPELQTPSQFVRIGGASNTGYVDPFTGGGRYVPGGIPEMICLPLLLEIH
uniref:PFU domain-containing protein n=1 Tax=Ditylenchus dipsaci TaxID=166011 RepID=A0A915ETT4_9BILA